jgi:hypothetical protein
LDLAGMRLLTATSIAATIINPSECWEPRIDTKC